MKLRKNNTLCFGELFSAARSMVFAILASYLLVSCGGGAGDGGDSAPDNLQPSVSSTTPLNGAAGAAVNAAITATFSEAMTASTITTATFTLDNGVTGTVDYSGTTATFTPSSDLAYSTAYTATITSGAKDSAGNALASDYTWSFTTGVAPDTTPPTVSSTTPLNGATGAAVNAAITATFSEAMTASTITTATFTLDNGVTGTVDYSGTTATFTPSSDLAYSTAYTATITSGAKDSAGNALASDYTWSFTTGVAPDTTPPTVSSTTPLNGATWAAVNAAITATFSEAMTASTITTATFTLDNGVTGTVDYSGTTATFTPSSDLAYSTAYTATITSGAKDSAGNALASDYTWSFTTAKRPINIDTGITSSQCFRAGSDVRVACGSAEAIALNSTQDGMAGRDANLLTNDNADGTLGLSFTSVSGGCVLDNVTGLMWEVKTTDGGLRDRLKTYTNFSASYDPSSQYGTATDAAGFVSAVNASSLCGFNDWRLPTVDELQTIMNYGVASTSPTIDTTWFPNTLQSNYWSATPYVGDTSWAWFGNFLSGKVGYFSRNTTYFIRLVRAGQ